MALRAVTYVYRIVAVALARTDLAVEVRLGWRGQSPWLPWPRSCAPGSVFEVAANRQSGCQRSARRQSVRSCWPQRYGNCRRRWPFACRVGDPMGGANAARRAAARIGGPPCLRPVRTGLGFRVAGIALELRPTRAGSHAVLRRCAAVECCRRLAIAFLRRTQSGLRSVARWLLTMVGSMGVFAVARPDRFYLLRLGQPVAYGLITHDESSPIGPARCISRSRCSERSCC